MFRHKGTFKSAAILFVFFIFFSLFSFVFIIPRLTFAGNLTEGPALVSGNLVQGQPQTINATFKAPSAAGPVTYMLDTEVFSGATGAKVAQFSEALTLNSAQTVTRSYTWKTTGLNPGKYVIKQGLFSSDWKNVLSWNDASATTNLSAPTVAAKVAQPTATPAPTAKATAAPAPALTWTAGGRLASANPVANTNVQLAGTFGAAVSGNYILDFELFNSSNSKIDQYFVTTYLTAGANQAINWNWPAKATGTLKLKLGIFTTNWQQKAWNDTALSFTVAAGGATVATPTAAPTLAPQSTPSGQGFMRGVNLSGGEFGDTKLPGVYGIDYTYPGNAELDYYNSKGLKLVRLPFLWERVQPSLWGNLNQTELGRINAVIAAAKARNMKIILDPHNYARYTLNGTPYLIGSSQVPVAAFKDFWTKMAAYYKNETAIYAFSLMNEPHDTNNTWATAAQAGLDAIRASDSAHTVLVPGDAWSGAWSWKQYNSNLLLRDPANKVLYEAHQYFDRDSSGTYKESYDASGAYPTIGADRVQPFIDWLNANHVHGLVTEYGVPNNDARWQTVLDNFLARLDAAGVGGTYWAGGPWWGSYSLSAEPSGGKDKPVMGVLVKHLGK